MLKAKLKPKQLARMDRLIGQGLHDFRLGKFPEAVRFLHEAFEIAEKSARKPANYREALACLASSLARTGDIGQALLRQAELLTLAPSDKQAKAGLLSLLHSAGVNLPGGEPFETAVLKALHGTDISGCIVELANLLLANRVFLKLFNRILAADGQSLPPAMLRGEYADLTENRLLHRLISCSPIPLPDFERLFRKLRKALLQARIQPENAVAFQDFADKHRTFLANLAHYLWLTEYAIFVDQEESRLLTELESGLDKALAEFAGLDAALLADLSVFALYQPFQRLKAAEVLFEIPLENWPFQLQKILKEYLNFREEQRIKPIIGSLTGIGDGVSMAVRQQYEENPYPRWNQPPEPSAKRSLAAIMAQLAPELAPPTRFSAPVDILVAGCGTGYLVFKIAADIETASLLAIDLSLSSLAYASRMADETRVTGIEFRQADILQLAALERRFDFIVCTGVLHHLEQPMAGWRILNGLLRPGGVMYIALYSEIARQAVVKARRVIANRDLQPTPDSMRLLRGEILDNHYPDLQILLNWQDFYSLSMFRDMAFHVNEHLYTWPKIKACLAELDLSLIGLAGLGADIMHAYRRRFPDDPRALNLDNWALFEAQNPLTFINMYSFYAARD